MLFGEPTPTLPLLREGRVRAIAVSSQTRFGPVPDIPTVAESGVTGFHMVSWQMIVAPSATPKEIVARLHSELKSILTLPEIKKVFAETGRIGDDSPPAAVMLTVMHAVV